MAYEFKNLVSAALDPTNINLACSIAKYDNAMVVTSNVSSQPPTTEVAGLVPRMQHIDTDVSHSIADTGVTLVFVQDGIPVVNMQPAKSSLTVNLPDRHQVKSTHTCDVVVPGLPSPLVGHIVPNPPCLVSAHCAMRGAL
jgi:hypothetical protein